MSVRLASDLILRFASPWLLSLLFLVPLLAALPILARQRWRFSSLRYADLNLTADLPLSWRFHLRPFLPVMRLLIIILIIVALARPQAGQEQELIRGEGIDITMALDISGSMASLDFEPRNRLEAAKQVISDFVESREYDRIGLVVFARNAFIQSPPTLDYGVLLDLLQEVKLADQLRIQDGTAIGMGLANAATLLKDTETASKVVILLTDGVNNSGEIDPLTAAEAAKALGIKVYTVGAARSGRVPVPIPGLPGRVVFRESVLDEEILIEIASMTGGQYFRAEDTASLEEIYDIINDLEKSDVEVRIYTRYRELAPWFLLPALLLFVTELTLSQTILRQIP